MTPKSTHLTGKRKSLKPLIEAMVQAFAPLYIYQIAKKIHQEKIKSVFCDGKGERQCTYYLFMIVGDSAVRENLVQEFADQTCLDPRVVIRVCPKEVLLQNVHHRNAYLARVINEGKLRYAAPGMERLNDLQLPNLKKRLGRVIVHWRKRKEMADSFFTAADQAIEAGQEHVGLFLLHHVTEQACLGLIYSFMDDQPDCRDLERLLQICACFSNRPYRHFLGCAQTEELLKIMVKGYHQAHQDERFSLGNHSIYRFLELVESFLKLANTLCQDRFAVLQSEVDQVKVLKEGTVHG
ncbi:hypothetical protein OQZ29_20755 [Pedobacter agri]|uniref:Uncharacterized protein n=1 Tax=Pedobacter agri TaxID=454586 RepID=A0A9X3DGR1_9SPHI|nr:hypothetical protein [Pedobacter agri]MCX3267204.1 hypothetical protein [Pedobacter agri]